MTERDDFYRSARFEEAMVAVAEETQRLDQVGELYRTETTTVYAKDRSFAMTFDGRGDLSTLTFHGTRYRTMAPAELADLLVTTVAAGRLQSVQKVAAIMADSMPGVDFVGLATGKVEPREVLDVLVAPLLNGFGPDAKPGRSATRSGWES